MITTISGSNHFMIDSELDKNLNQFKEKFGDLAIEQIDGSDNEYQTILDSISNLPFLTPSKLVILKSPSSNKQFMEKIESLVDDIPENNEVIIIETNLDKRSKYFKFLKANTDFKDFEELDPGNLAGWITETVKAKGGQISRADANYIIEKVGVNQLRIKNEIDKLVSFNPDISRESIDELVESTPQTTIFQLLDAAFSGKRKELMRIYEDQRKQKVEPQQIIAMLTWQLNALALVKAAGDMPANEISRKTKLSPFVVGKSMSIARRLSFEEIKELISRLLDLDILLKTKSVDSDDALTQYLLSI